MRHFLMLLDTLLSGELFPLKHAWDRQTLQEEETHATPHGTFQERKRPQIYLCHAATMSHIIDFEPSYYEEACSQLVWREAMMDEYQSIMKNDVWDIVS